MNKHQKTLAALVLVLLLVVGTVVYLFTVYLPEQKIKQEIAAKAEKERQRVILRDKRIQECIESLKYDWDQSWKKWCEIQNLDMTGMGCILSEENQDRIKYAHMLKIDDCYMIYWDRTLEQLDY